MTATGQNFEVYRNKDKIIVVQTFDENGAPQPITGSTLLWLAYRKTTGEIVLIKSNTPPYSGIAITDADMGLFEITLTQADTDSLVANMYFHECELTDFSGFATSILTGIMS